MTSNGRGSPSSPRACHVKHYMRGNSVTYSRGGYVCVCGDSRGRREMQRSVNRVGSGVSRRSSEWLKAGRNVWEKEKLH